MRGPSDLLALTPPPPAPQAAKPTTAPPKRAEFSHALTAAKKKSAKPAASKQASKSAKPAPKPEADATAKHKNPEDQAKKQATPHSNADDADALAADKVVAGEKNGEAAHADAAGDDADSKAKDASADQTALKSPDASDEPAQPVKAKAKAAPDAGKAAAAKTSSSDVAAQAALQLNAAKQPQAKIQTPDSNADADGSSAVSPLGQNGDATGPVLQAEQPVGKVAAKAQGSAGNANALPQVAAADVEQDDPVAEDDAAAAPATAGAKPAKASTDLKMPAIPDGSAAPKATGQPTETIKAAPAPPPTPPEAQFAEANHPKLVSGMRGQLLPGGGTMQIRLDPPQLGDLQVTVKMQNGVMTASFQTSNDDATRLLSHSLGQLKQTLETQGISVEKLHVTQAPKTSHSGFGDDAGGQQQPEARSGQQEQQRREMMRRMWRRMSIGRDALDMVA